MDSNRRYWKKPLSEAELAAEAELFALEITEEQAENSDVNGDSDAEDNLLDEPQTPRSTRASCSSGSHSGLATPSSSGLSTPTPQSSRERKKTDRYVSLPSEDDFDDYDSDDSIADKTYEPDEPRFFQVPQNSDSEEEVEEQEIPVIPTDDFATWNKIPVAPQKYIDFSFVDEMGPKVQVDSEEPIDFFEIFFQRNFLDSIVQQSNLYATQNHKRLDLSVEEFKAFIGVLIIMGFNSLPQIRKYWSRSQNFHNKRISNVFPVKRFIKILRFLHVNDNSQMPSRNRPNYDKLYKIRPVIQHFSEVFPASFTPHRSVAIDESMIAFKGRSSLKQYMPMKPIKRGFKIWAMSCSMSGYLLAFDVYQGKEEVQSENTLGERVILKLATQLEGRGFCTYFDNFFTTIPLMKKLSDKDLFGCGTIRQSRKFFPKHKLQEDKKMAIGQSDYTTCKEISICKWKDRGKKAVTVCSNMHNAAEIGQVLRTNKYAERENVPCPKPIVDYNKFMGGVDRFDQRMAAYSIAWKSRRWWMKLFYYFFDAGIVNSYILYRETLKSNNSRKKPMTHLQYRSKLVDQLILNFTARKKPGPPQVLGAFENINHLPQKTTSRRCQQCSKRGLQKRSNVMCIGCEVALCIECFVPYHNV